MQPVPREISNKESKELVNYRHYESCITCGFFNQAGTCSQVDGTISPQAVCNKFSMKEKLPEIKHAEFYRNEYERSNS
jgi:hypothetical protein